MGGLQRDASVRGYFADSRLHSCGKFHQQQLYWFLNLRNIRPGKSATEISMDVWVGYPCLSLVSVFFLGAWANQLSDNAWLTQKPNLHTEDTRLKRQTLNPALERVSLSSYVIAVKNKPNKVHIILLFNLTFWWFWSQNWRIKKLKSIANIWEDALMCRSTLLVCPDLSGSWFSVEKLWTNKI